MYHAFEGTVFTLSRAKFLTRLFMSGSETTYLMNNPNTRNLLGIAFAVAFSNLILSVGLSFLSYIFSWPSKG